MGGAINDVGDAAKQWIVGGGGKGRRYSLNPNGCWKEALQDYSISAIEQAGSISNQSAGPIMEQCWTDSHLALISEAIQDIDQKKN
jgi:hypothetical protein